MEFPEWLPPLVDLAEVDGDYAAYLDLLYQYYTEDFILNTSYIRDRPVRTMNDQSREGKEESFWHILEGRKHAELDPTLERHKRIRWVRPVINALEETPDRIRFWGKKVRKGRSVRKTLCIALADFSYLVVLSIRPGKFLLITGYPFLREHQRRKLEKEYRFYTCPENAIPLE